MGMTFSNIHIRKNDGFTVQDLFKKLIDTMTKKGYNVVPSKSEADVSSIIYSPQNSGWITIVSDEYNFSNEYDMKKAIQPFSESLKTDVIAISCVDSDFAFLEFLNTSKEIDGWLNIEEPYCNEKLRKSDIEIWKKEVSDQKKFDDIINDSNTYAENAICEICELLGFANEQCTLNNRFEDYENMLDKSAVIAMHFALPKKDTEEPTKLVIPRFNLMPCQAGKTHAVSCVNKGGASKGLAVEFFGDCFDSGEITVENVALMYYDDKGERLLIPIELKRVESTQGEYFLCWKDENFQIPPKVDNSLPYNVFSDKEFKHEIGVRFTPVGNPRKMLDIMVALVPLSNFKMEACAEWYVWMHYKSKADYIKSHNESWKWKADNMLDPNDFDL
ncbi:MAG: hypothetical protein ACI4I6_08865 [Hominimerdicola sp.]